MTEGQLLPPESRYGAKRLSRRSRRGIVIALAALVLALGVAIAFVGYQRLGTSEVEGKLAGYRLIDGQTVEVTITVTRSDPSRPAVCIVRGRSKDGSETGRREILVGPSEATSVQVTTVVKTSRPPVIGDVYGCGTDVPGYLVAP
ncbi:DUF4307 domain-containing protein [Mycolicibacterium mengxianglii]|uniref:DUF4307 domain-containing protein n=1 Tax=Mycolicibacterium mengxianglii TaxID=2736649 RepID=UPI0018EED29E|nr:DUF4307 domain-containing protein [Mycolicibacterium mengxianglii]